MFVKYIIRFAVIMSIQIFLLNNVLLKSGLSINGYSVFVPFFYILFLIMLPVNLNKSLTLIVCFITGLVMDLYSNTHGLHASACLLLGLVRPFIIEIFFNPTDKNYNKTIPTLSKMGIKNFLTFSFILTLIFNFYYYLVDIWSVHHLVYMFIKIILSTIVSLILFLVSQALFISSSTKRR